MGLQKTQTYNDTSATQNIPANYNVPTNIPESSLAPLDCCCSIKLGYGSNKEV